MKYRLLSFSVISLSALPLLAACAAFGPSRSARVDDGRVRILERELKRRQAAMEELHERNLVLEKRSLTGQGQALTQASQSARPTTPVPFDPSAGMERQVAPLAPLAKRQAEPVINFPAPAPLQQVLPTSQLLAQSSMPTTGQKSVPPRVLPARISASPSAEKISPIAANVENEAATAVADDVEQTGEQKLYSKVLETYRSHNPVELQKVLDILLKAYADSVYADNALYLAGLLSFENGDLARASNFMERVMREYPKGNKAVSALFAKAMIEKRSGKFPQARETLKAVRIMYPGSPEAARATNEVKFIDLASQPKHREG